MSAPGEKSTPKSREPKAQRGGVPREEEPQECGTDGQASERFVRDLEVRGEAAKPSKSGKLPLGSTHAVVRENPDGTVKQVKRARFKAF